MPPADLLPESTTTSFGPLGDFQPVLDAALPLCGDRDVIFLSVAGSHAYGTSTEHSDIDVRGVYMPGRDEILSIFPTKEHVTKREPIDFQLYDLRHFLRLALKGSPLQVEMLFYPADVALIVSPVWQGLLKLRTAFLGKHLSNTLGGYAQADLKAISGDLTRKCGAKGKARIEKYGYNTAQAANAYRLLAMQRLLWKTNMLHPRMGDLPRTEIMALKEGSMTKEQFLDFIAGEEADTRRALENNVDLPPGPDVGAVQAFYTNAATYEVWLGS